MKAWRARHTASAASPVGNLQANHAMNLIDNSVTYRDNDHKHNVASLRALLLFAIQARASLALPVADLHGCERDTLIHSSCAQGQRPLRVLSQGRRGNRLSVLSVAVQVHCRH